MSDDKTEFYLIRHAETVLNVNPHIVNGRSNETLLTYRGVEQSKRLGRALLQRNIIPGVVFSSPAVRTLATAGYSLSEMGLDLEPIVQDEIQELSQGNMEGRLRDEVYTEDTMIELKTKGKDFKLDGGESMNDVGNRMYNWMIHASASEQLDGLNRHFVYTHGGAIKCLASQILGWDQDQTYKTEIRNTSVNLFTIQDGLCEVVYLNQDPLAI